MPFCVKYDCENHELLLRYNYVNIIQNSNAPIHHCLKAARARGVFSPIESRIKMLLPLLNLHCPGLLSPEFAPKLLGTGTRSIGASAEALATLHGAAAAAGPGALGAASVRPAA